MSADVLFVTVNYYTENEVLGLVGSLFAQTAPWRLVIADNGSHEAGRRALAELASQCENVQLRVTGMNLGYFAAADVVLSESRLPDWVVVSNPDITLAPDFVHALTQVDADVVAPRILDAATGADLNPFMGSKPQAFYTWSRKVIFSQPLFARTWMLLSMVRSRKRKSQDRFRCIYAGHGSVLAFRRSYFEGGGDLRHEPFLFGEELTVAENVRRMGGRIVYAPGLRAKHTGHVATGRWPSRQMLRYQREATRYAHRLLRQDS